MSMTKKQKRSALRIALSVVLLAVCAVTAHFVQLPQWAVLLLFAVPYFVSGFPVLAEAAGNIVRGQIFDEKFLMALATVGAFVVGEYPEASFVMIFFQIGELFESMAVGKSRRAIADLMDIRPDRARTVCDGQINEVDPEEVQVGMYIQVLPGERVPLDGIVCEGSAALDTAALTGESLPREVGVGDAVISGCINTNGVLLLHVTKPYEKSTVARILELVENAGIHKAKSEKFITRFAKYYTPCVCAAALLLAVLPPVVTGQANVWSVWSDWIYRAMIFLVISCPCALVISVPLSFFGGIGGAGAKGILIKGSEHLENIARCKTFVFDKTGTLTQGNFTVSDVLYADGFTEKDVLYYAATAEQHSSHPLAKAVCAESERIGESKNVHEKAGFGVSATVDGKLVFVGSEALLRENGIAVPAGNTSETAVFVAVEGRYAGCIALRDRVKEDAKQAIAELRNLGVKRICMLTGDREEAALRDAKELGIDEVYAQLLPQDKVEAAQKIRSAVTDGSLLAFVGDGINDAPVLAAADVGFAMGAFGSDAAVEAADAVLMNDRLQSLVTAVAVSTKTTRIVKQNIVFALAVKFAVLLLSPLGFANMGIGIFADVGVCVLAVCNALRAMKIKS